MRVIPVATIALVSLCSALLVETRLVLPLHDPLYATFNLHASRHVPTLEERIESYYVDSAFPKAGRTLLQKIDEAQRFLAEEVPKSGFVGLGASVVYRDQVVLATGYGLQSSSNTNSVVSHDSIFQIGSVTKLMIAVGMGLLVEEGKVQWRDPVKTHLPWLKMNDSYAESHVTIGNLLSMNSGYGRRPDFGDFFAGIPTEREYVEALQDVPPEFSLREQPAYANANFVILGQLIEHVTGQAWHDFLRDRVWTPLNMTHTFGSAELVPPTIKPYVSDAHIVCHGEKTQGPFDLVTSPETPLAPGRKDGLHAAGSIVSSASDMATFARLLLNKGHVNGVTLFKNPATIAELITGKNPSALGMGPMATIVGLHYSPDGSSLSAGYGIDTIGHVMWGHAYYDKGGDTIVHHTRTGFVPGEQLAVVLMQNSNVMNPVLALDQLRSYVLGIFLDVPKHMLEQQYAKWRAALPKPPTLLPGASECGPAFWSNPPLKKLTDSAIATLVGTYKSRLAPRFFPVVTITRDTKTSSSSSDVHFHIRVGAREGPLLWIETESTNSTTPEMLIGNLPGIATPIPATLDVNGQYTLDLGIQYDKQ